MKRCWDHNPENRSTAREIHECLHEYCYGEHYGEPQGKKENIELAEAKRQKIIKSDEYLLDKKNYKHHPGSFYTSRLLNESIQQAESLLNLSSTEIWINNKGNNDNDDLSDKKNYRHHPESFYTSSPSSGLTQQAQVQLLNFSSIGIGSKTHYIDDDDDDNGSIKKKLKIFHK